MSANPILYGRAVKQDAGPWKSQWRLDLERRMAEDAASRPALKRPAAAKRLAASRTVNRALGQRPARTREPVRLCAKGCGRRVRGAGIEVCSRCRSGSDPKLRRECANRCGGRINGNNRTGLCNGCYQKRRMLLKLGPRPKCSFPRCMQLLQRKNPTGLCGWHNPTRCTRERYRETSPRMQQP
jgi:hypothetical protein